MARIQWEYELVERPFCRQLHTMGWQWLEGDVDVPELTERTSFCEVLLKARLADYVIAHELAHLLEPHHGPQFSRLLDRSLPDWRERQQELQVKAAAIHWCGANMGQRGNLGLNRSNPGPRSFPVP
ncbi:MAG: M48 family metallopeptidase [Planctomycetota bacterium]|nr:M48 family metallopeptidase [Planctomycetota bacterium]